MGSTNIFLQPKLLPLKSVTLEKLERMQKEANERAKQMEQEKEEGEQVHQRTYIIRLGDNLEIAASKFQM